MSFTYPDRLLLVLLAAAAFIFLYRALERRAKTRALTYSNLAFAIDALRPSRLPSFLLLGALTLGVAALAITAAGPRLWLRVPVKDGTVMLCIDTSGSMSATDLVPTRAEASKAAARAFLDEVPPGTRVGLLTSATGASIIVAPTDDLDAVRKGIDYMPPANGGTAIGDALALAGRAMPNHGKRVIVLMTDGVNNAGVDPVDAARTVAASGVTIETVGIGTNGSGELIPGTNEPADLDEDTLRAIAQTGDGRYVSVGDAGSLRSAFASIARSSAWERKRVDGSTYFALGGGLTLLLAFLGGFAVGRFP
jgi:Ca-activated chloride channel family protein